MNILIATYLTSASPSGVVTYYRTLSDDLTGAGVDVQTVDSTSTPIWWRKFLSVLKRIMRPLGNIFYVLYDEFAYFTGVYLSTRRLRQTPFDLIHAQDVRSGVAASLALGWRVPVVLTCHFNDDPVLELVNNFKLKPGFTRRLRSWYTYLFSRIHNYIFVSEYAYEESKHLLPANIQKRIIRNTVQINPRDLPGRPDDIAPDQVIISNVGYVDERKNQQLLLNIGYELMKRGISNFRLWFIGDGPKRAEYAMSAQQLGIGERVQFFGQQSTPWTFVAQSDLYVHTALNDNCPYSIVEAFAVGKPVLALPVGGVPEMLPEGLGLLWGADVQALTDEVTRYFDVEARRQLAATQAAYAAREFNNRLNWDALLSFYKQIIGQSVSVTTQPATHAL